MAEVTQASGSRRMHVPWGKPSLKEVPTTMRRFYLLRHRDVSGVSGEGVVAEGVEFSGGDVVLRWHGGSASLCIYNSMKAIERVHCHKGETEIVWLDEKVVR